MPTVAYYLVTNAKKAGDPTYFLEGLWYPIILTGVCFLIGLMYITKRKEKDA